MSCILVYPWHFFKNWLETVQNTRNTSSHQCLGALEHLGGHLPRCRERIVWWLVPDLRVGCLREGRAESCGITGGGNYHIQGRSGLSEAARELSSISRCSVERVGNRFRCLPTYPRAPSASSEGIPPNTFSEGT